MRPSWDESVQPTPQEGMKKCPFCAELIQAEAIKCRYCGEFLTGRPAPADPKDRGKWYQSSQAIVVALLTLGPLALPMVWTNPQISKPVKMTITIAVIIVTIILCILLFYAIVWIYNYYMKILQI